MKIYKYQTAIAAKNLADLSSEELIAIHLGSVETVKTKDFEVHSCLHTLEKNMNHTTENSNINTYAPVLCAFAILDQIGTTYEPKDPTNTTDAENGIKRALHYFGSMSSTSDETRALVSFRNGLIHDGSFTSYDRQKHRHYIFRYNPNIGEVIIVSTNVWDGSRDNLDERCTTYINKKLFIDLVMKVLRKLREEFENNNINKIIDDKSIIHKFLLWKKEE